MTLLCKLCWRLLVDQRWLWFKVLTTKYDFEGAKIGVEPVSLQVGGMTYGV